MALRQSLEPLTLRELAPVVALWLLLGLALLLLFNLGTDIWRATGAASAAPPAQAAPARALDTRRAATLFGDAGPVAANASPETDLQLTLRGVFTSTGENGGSAIIETSDGTVRHYRSGREIVPGARLGDVRSDSVELLRDDGRETLFFPTPQARALASAGLEAAVPSAGAEMDDRERRERVRRKLEELRARALAR